MPLSKEKNKERMKQSRATYVQPSTEYILAARDCLDSVAAPLDDREMWLDGAHYSSKAVQPSAVPPYPTPLTTEQFKIAHYPKILAKGERCTLEHCIICYPERSQIEQGDGDVGRS